MGKGVYANGMEIAHKAGANKVICAFPDVCLSPPSPPAGPVPIPYPDTSMAGTLKDGSRKVKIGGQPAALHGQSHYKSSPLGNEAATRSFGASVITHQITGKTFFQASSMDVEIEGKKVNRHLDLTTSNHGSQPGATPPMPGLESMNLGGGDGGADDDTPTCPCCGGPAHANQVGDDGRLLPTVTEDEFYAGQTHHPISKAAEMAELLKTGPYQPWFDEVITKVGDPYEGLTKSHAKLDMGRRAKEALEKLRQLRAANAGCPNLHNPPDSGCGTHFKPSGKSSAARREFNRKRSSISMELKRQGDGQPQKPGHMRKINHKTPIGAGGCPVSSNNTIPDSALQGPCAEIESLQSFLQSL